MKLDQARRSRSYEDDRRDPMPAYMNELPKRLEIRSNNYSKTKMWSDKNKNNRHSCSEAAGENPPFVNTFA